MKRPDLPLIPAIEALIAEAEERREQAAGYPRVVTWACDARLRALRECLALAEKQHRAYSDAACNPSTNEAVPASR